MNSLVKAQMNAEYEAYEAFEKLELQYEAEKMAEMFWSEFEDSQLGEAV